MRTERLIGTVQEGQVDNVMNDLRQDFKDDKFEVRDHETRKQIFIVEYTDISQPKFDQLRRCVTTAANRPAITNENATRVVAAPGRIPAHHSED